MRAQDGGSDLERVRLLDPPPVVVGGRPPVCGEVDAEALADLLDHRVGLVLEGELGLQRLRDAPGEERLLGLRRKGAESRKARGGGKAQPGKVELLGPGRQAVNGGRVLEVTQRAVRVGLERAELEGIGAIAEVQHADAQAVERDVERRFEVAGEVSLGDAAGGPSGRRSTPD